LTVPLFILSDKMFDAFASQYGFPSFFFFSTSGSYSSFSDIDQNTLITSSYISSVVVTEGGGVYQFTPTSNVALSSSFLRGTGGISVGITV